MGKYFVGKPRLFGNRGIWNFDEAVEAAKDGDTIELESGFNIEGKYADFLPINKNITIEGTLDSQTGNITNHLGSIFIKENSNVTLKNLILSSKQDGNIINVKGSSVLTADNLYIDSKSNSEKQKKEHYPAVYVADSSQVSISRVTICAANDNTMGIYQNSKVNLESFTVNGLIDSDSSNITLESGTINGPFQTTSSDVRFEKVNMNTPDKLNGLYMKKGSLNIDNCQIIGGSVDEKGEWPALDIYNSTMSVTNSLISSIIIDEQVICSIDNTVIYGNAVLLDAEQVNMTNSIIGGISEYIKGYIPLYVSGHGKLDMNNVVLGNVTNPVIKIEKKVNLNCSNLSRILLNQPLKTMDDLTKEFDNGTKNIDANDVITFFGEDSAYQKLQDMVGLKAVKNKVDEILANSQLNERRKAQGLAESEMTLHSLFLGNPGTGKTTVARLFGEILYEKGIIREKKFNEVSRSDLCSDYVGETAKKTHELLEKSLGGVLFVDEAYTLYKENIKNDPGKEAIDEILSFMENHRDDIVIIFAGYEKEMETFLEANPGLKSRIPNEFMFEDFTESEMAELGLKDLSDKGFIVDNDAYANLVKERLRLDNDDSNGRWVRNLNEKLLSKQSLRLSKSNANDSDLRVITSEDIDAMLPDSVENDGTDSNQGSQKSAYDQLMDMTGLESVKKQVKKFIALSKINKNKEKQGIKTQNFSLHSLFLGNPGTGKTTVARLLGQILCDNEITQKNIFNETSRADLVGRYEGETEKNTRKILDKSLGGVLFIDEAYTLYNPNDKNDPGKEAMDEILSFMENHRNEIVIIFAGYEKEMETFLEVNPGLKSRIPNTFTFEDYSEDEMVELGFKKLSDEGYKVDEDAYANLVKESLRLDNDNSNGRWVRNLNEKLLSAQSLRLAEAGDVDDFMTITAEDIDSILPDAAKQSDDTNQKSAYDQLMDMIGLESVKKQVKKFIALSKINKNKEKQGIKTQNFSLHSLFLGNPGTGKTTVARLLGQILCDNKITQKNIFNETSRADLVAKYVGQTAIKTRKVLKKSLGGVLFIDEAYTLYKEDNKDDFGKEAIEEILSFMENHRNEIVIIFAGYKNEMETFLEANPGFKSRIPNTFTFEDYSEDEMVELGFKKLSDEGYKVDTDAYANLVKESLRLNNDNSNGRWVRNLNEKLLSAQSLRISEAGDVDEDDFMTITNEDIESILPDASKQNQGPQKSAYDQLMDMIGLESVKKQVKKFIAFSKINKSREEQGLNPNVSSLHSLFLGNPGTGKTTVARLLGQILCDNKITQKNIFNETSRADLVGTYEGDTEKNTRKILEKSLGGVLFIDEAYTLYNPNDKNDPGKEAMDEILSFMENHRNEIVIIFAGYKDEMETFLEVNPGLKSRIPNTFTFEDYSEDEMVELGLKKLSDKGFIIDSDAYANLVKESLRLNNDNSNGRWVRNLNEKLLNAQSLRLANSGNINEDDFMTITNEDIESILPDTAKQSADDADQKSAYDQLMDMVGLESVKKQVREFVALAKINKSRKEQGLKTNVSSLHSLFLGNPGTGKTTVARLLGQILCDNKITQKNIFNETSRADLVGRYEGETEQKTRNILEKSLGGVLFVDEAYTLYKPEDRNDFGKEAINEILSFMENNRDNIVIIFAGYKKEMETFLQSNPGLKSRIPNTFTFEDYSADELTELGLNELSREQYVVNKDEYAQLVAHNHEVSYDNSNGRWIRNVNQELQKVQSIRLAETGDLSKDSLLTITGEDLQKCYK